MKIEYEIPDEEFSTFLAALNNGVLSLNHIYFCLNLGLQVPSVFEPLEDNYSCTELMELTSRRMDAFKKFYAYLESLEKVK